MLRRKLTPSIYSRLVMIIAMIMVSGFLGLCGSVEIRSSAILHKLNFLHIKYNHIFYDRIANVHEISKNVENIKQDLSMIRAQPLACLDEIGPLNQFLMEVINTDRAIELCVNDIRLANETLDRIEQFEKGEISVNTLANALQDAQLGFQQNSTEFQPLVDTTVESIFQFVLVSLVVGIALILVFSVTLIKGIARDYSRIKSAEETLLENQKCLQSTLSNLKEMKEAAEAANRTKSSFLANMSHELRTPLNAIIGFASIMKEQILGPIGNDRYLDYAEDIQTSSEHLAEILGDILDLAKVEAGELDLHERPLSINDLIESCIGMVSGLADEADIYIQPSLEKQLPLLLADELRIKQIIINLITNSLKFTPSKGRIIVGAKLNEKDGLTLWVEDNGIGIPEGELQKVLEPFAQLVAEQADSTRGVGLGLSLSKLLAELHGATLRIESRVKIGTTVSVEFPSERLQRLSHPHFQDLASEGIRAPA